MEWESAGMRGAERKSLVLPTVREKRDCPQGKKQGHGGGCHGQEACEELKRLPSRFSTIACPVSEWKGVPSTGAGGEIRARKTKEEIEERGRKRQIKGYIRTEKAENLQGCGSFLYYSSQNSFQCYFGARFIMLK